MSTTSNDKTKGQTMFLDFYGLREQPFGVTPDPRFLYMTRSHREALASLVYSIETKRGFSALVAEPGMGKTSLLFYLLEKIKPSARTAFLFRPDRNTKELLESLLMDLGVEAASEDVPQMHDQLNSVLLEEMQSGRKFVWVLDEAQDLDNAVLESVRLLSNFETPASKLMHIVLAGQTALSDKLAGPDLVQLRQRVSTHVRLRIYPAPNSRRGPPARKSVHTPGGRIDRASEPGDSTQYKHSMFFVPLAWICSRIERNRIFYC
jgi:general secretion pathway protein A